MQRMGERKMFGILPKEMPANSQVHSLTSNPLNPHSSQFRFYYGHVHYNNYSPQSLPNHHNMFLFRMCCSEDRPTAHKSQIPKQTKPIQRQPKYQTPAREVQAPATILSINTPRESMQCSKMTRADRYQGQELNGVPNGTGSMLYANGDFYRGEWVNGIKQGRGMQIYNQLNMQYEGEWQKDKHDGNGKLTMNNSSYYIGEFKEGVKWGKGQHYDAEKKKMYDEVYERGELREQKEEGHQHSGEEEFPTLNLDKERFNTIDLSNFQKMHPNIKELDMAFLMKYYCLSKIAQLSFVTKNLNEWGMKEVLDFLDTIQMKAYRQVFYKNKIKGKDLITLKESELKDDLKLKIGDRKRFMNYVKYLSDLHGLNKEEKSVTKGSKRKTKDNYKLLSVGSMKNALKNVKNEVYKQSIMQESSESQRQGQEIFNKESQAKEDSIQKTQSNELVDTHKYVSAAQHVPNQNKNQLNFSSIQRLIEPLSERSQEHSSSKRDITRKNSRDISQGNGNFQILFNKTHHNINQQENINGFERYSQRLVTPEPQNQMMQAQMESNSSEEVTKLKLQRQQTIEKSHLHLQTSEIRELYDFLKSHRNLSFFIKEKDIEEIQLIGQGGFGKVYRGKYIGQQIAIKDFLKTGPHHRRQDFMKQLQIISDLKHPNIVLYMGICITANKYTLITEYLQNGSLFDQLHKKKKKFTEIQQMSIAYDIVKGMVYLHNMKKILHRDLKSSNVLIGENWQVKLCDFGLSGQKKKSSKRSRNKIGTAQWMAPEVMRNEDKIDQYADVYSFGVIIWELLTERIPYDGLSEQQITGLVGYDQHHEFQEPKGNSFLKIIMRKCLNRMPNQRPKFIEIQTEFQEWYNSMKEKEWSS